MLNKIYTFVFLNFILISTSFADIQEDMIPVDNTIITNVDWDDWLVAIFSYMKETIFYLLMIISVWAFLFVGFKLIMAKWNPEEFKKAFLNFIYVVVGIVFVSLAYVLVSLVSGVQF